MDRWKKAGRAGRNEDDALWARFREAADTFFNARQADREQISADEKENLAKKEELLKKAEALVPVADEKAAKQARQALAAIQDEWDQIGYVPREDMRRIEGRLDKGEKVVVVEDLISTGGSVLETVEALREAGAEVLGVVSIFTYGMKKGVERMAEAGVKNVSLTNLDTIAQVGAEEGYIAPEDVSRLLKFRDNPSDESWINGGKN